MDLTARLHRMMPIVGFALVLCSAAVAQTRPTTTGTAMTGSSTTGAPAAPPTAGQTGPGSPAGAAPMETGAPVAAVAAAPSPNSPPLDCNSPQPILPPAGNLKTSLTPDVMTGWQPRGGEVRFKMAGAQGLALDRMPVVACFRWQTLQGGGRWTGSPSALQVIAVDVGSLTFGATVPLLETAPVDVARTGFWLVPVAELRILAWLPSAEAWSPFDTVIPVGITDQRLSAAFALLTVLITAIVLSRFGSNRAVPGRNAVLKIVSTRDGHASLSQLQMILWSFVIGASAVYVMALSGSLIDIKIGTLVLLGISGIAVVGSKLQSSLEPTQDSSAAATPAVPGAVTGLHARQPPSAGEVCLAWTAPAGGGPVRAYTVVYRPAGGNWLVASATVALPGYTVVGLSASTAYEFQVFASNAGGDGPPSSPLAVQTAAATPVLQGAPAAVTGLIVKQEPGGNRIALSWAPAKAAARYLVQSRAEDSDEPWRTVQAVTATAATVTGLRAATAYAFRVIASNSNGDAPPSAPAYGRTGARLPKWSDLVVVEGSRNEIDVTRVQMLFFTVLSAVFVAIKVVASCQIPDIPDGFLLLMGISNGVYLTAKFVPS